MNQRQLVQTIDLEGSFNFRDLGGYETKSGRKVKSGILFRSGNLQNLTQNDIITLKKIGIRTIFDLRGSDEAKKHPTPKIPEVTNRHLPLIEIDRDAIRSPKDLADFSFQQEEDPGQVLIQLYRKVTKNVPVYKSILTTLLENPQAPILFHCMAGKDRTGVTAALTLHMLDVPEKLIFQDYLFTNQFIDALKTNLQVEKIQADKALIQAMLEARREYLQAFFDEIKSQFGSVDQYVKEAIGFTKNDVEMLKAHLLV
ncbi:tyrosine-protein phosphatase [Virgibacillus proomii]|jgi:protein-tyrosine phosphatase|uniref:tyrosine-protein phosphatase n=1 Tax=Virgibacillus proomii TaxID=84407 RepID=UPI0009858E5B|nr:tyrosine-protein phosphatase [Virgibacillus proomii]